MKLRNRVAFYFVSRLFWLMLIWGSLIVISTLLFSFFLGHNKIETPRLSISKIVADTVVMDQQLSINSKTKEDLLKNQMWVQVLDEQGNEIFFFNKPKTIPNHYIPGELVSDYLYPAKKGYQLSTWYETKNNQDLTWVLGKPMNSNNPFLYWMNNLWIFSIIVIGTLIALFFGKQLGVPLLYMVSWIENLSKGKYEEPFYYWKFHSKKRRLKKAEYKTYRELMQALSKLTSTLQKNTEERELLEKTREEWMTGVSHDLKTPLSVIKGYSVLLSSNEYDWEQEKVRHFAKTMEERVEYMEELIEDFSLTFQLKNEALPIQREEKNLVEVINNVLEQLKRLPESENKIFSFEPNNNRILFTMDERYLKRAVENLIANSIKHNPPNTKVRIILHEDSLEREIQLTIEDDGVGMDNETVERLFDRYFRGISASSNISGTGLGMAIARQIVIAHDGYIEIDSKPQLGTKCKIIFPLEL